MVDKAVLAAKTAAVRDAVARIRAVLPPTTAAFAADRTAREVVVLNLFVALQECAALASHWLSDGGWEVPATYGGLFKALADHGVLDPRLAERLSVAVGLRNLVAHQYGVLDPARVHAIATSDLDDLLAFTARLSELAS